MGYKILKPAQNKKELEIQIKKLINVPGPVLLEIKIKRFLGIL